MRLRALAVAAACCSPALASDARAVDLTLGWDIAPRWDSNVLRRSANEEDDFVIRTGPRMEVRENRGDLTGWFRWNTNWEGFLDTSGADNFEHFSDMSGTWQIDQRNVFELSNRFAFTDTITSQLAVEDGVLVAPGQDVEVGLQSTLLNQARAAFSHRLSLLDSLEGSISNTLVDYEGDDRSDVLSTRGSAQALRSLSPRTSIGLGAAFTRQDFGDTSQRDGSGTDIIEIFGIWNYQITPTLLLSSSLGPALNRPDDFEDSRRVAETPTLRASIGPATSGDFLIDAATCPQRADGSRVVGRGCRLVLGQDLQTNQPTQIPIAPGTVPLIEASFLNGGPEAEDALSLFGSLSLIKRWERVTARLLLQQRTNNAGGQGVSTNLTLASASFTWKPERQWVLSATAAWTLQTSASELPITETVVVPETIFVDENFRIVDGPAGARFRADGAAVTAGVREAGSTDNGFETTSYQLQLRATRTISRRLQARALFSLFRNETSGDLQSDRTVDSVRLELGLRWELDPIRF